MAEDDSDEEEKMRVGEFIYNSMELYTQTRFLILMPQEHENCIS